MQLLFPFQVHLSFLIVGHTHEDVDAGFSKISEKLRRNDAETLDSLIDLLPKPALLDQLFDFKAWVDPYFSIIEAISEPLHYKINRVADSVKVYCKGLHNQEWITMDYMVLSQKPKGKPKTVRPDFTKFNFDKMLKQINTIRHMFKGGEQTLMWWTEFYASLRANKRTSSVWMFDQLPRQKKSKDTDQISNGSPQQIIDLVAKETRIPKVIISALYV